MWRNYVATVPPTGPPYTNMDLRRHLLVALREIMKIHGISTLPKDEQPVGVINLYEKFVNY